MVLLRGFWFFRFRRAGRRRWRLFRRRRRRLGRLRRAALIGAPIAPPEAGRSGNPRPCFGRYPGSKFVNRRMIKHGSLRQFLPGRSCDWRTPKTIPSGVKAHYRRWVNGNRIDSEDSRKILAIGRGGKKISSQPCMEFPHDVAQSAWFCERGVEK
jgi:hypothetical protein